MIKLRHPPSRILASDIHGLCLSRRRAAGVPPVDPRGILYLGMYKYHVTAWVMVSDKGYQHCIYLGYEGNLRRVQLLATDGQGELSYASLQY